MSLKSVRGRKEPQGGLGLRKMTMLFPPTALASRYACCLLPCRLCPSQCVPTVS